MIIRWILFNQRKLGWLLVGDHGYDVGLVERKNTVKDFYRAAASYRPGGRRDIF